MHWRCKDFNCTLSVHEKYGAQVVYRGIKKMGHFIILHLEQHPGLAAFFFLARGSSPPRPAEPQ